MTAHPIRRWFLFVGGIALVLLVWLAAQPDYVHRSVIDPAEPLGTSNFLRARGFQFPWLVTEVPPELGSVPLAARVRLGGLGRLVLLAMLGGLALAAMIGAARWVWHGLGEL